MMTRNRSKKRRGMAMVEAAIVLPVTISLFLGTIVMGLGVFRHNQIAYLARQGSRWASVRGPAYQAAQKVSAPTASDVMTNVIVPSMNGLSQGSMTSSLTWNTTASPTTVTYTLNYTWTPEAYFSPVTFTSTSTQLITY